VRKRKSKKKKDDPLLMKKVDYNKLVAGYFEVYPSRIIAKRRAEALRKSGYPAVYFKDPKSDYWVVGIKADED